MIPYQDTSLTAPAATAKRRLLPGVGGPALPGVPSTAPMIGLRAPIGAPSATPAAAPQGWLGRAVAGAGGPSATPIDGPAMPAPTTLPAAPATPTNLGYGTTTPIDPNNDLRSKVIAPGAESNRADLANKYLDTWSNNELPQFRAALRGTIGDAAATGRTGSGMLRTDIGNLDVAEQNKYNTAASNFYTDALGNQITDNANQRAELRGERGYQVGQEQSAADRARQQLLDQETLTQGQFGRAATTLALGGAGNPAGVVGGAAQDAGARAAAGAANVGQSLGSSNYLDILRKILAQQQGGVKPTGTVPVPNDPYGMVS